MPIFAQIRNAFEYKWKWKLIFHFNVSISGKKYFLVIKKYISIGINFLYCKKNLYCSRIVVWSHTNLIGPYRAPDHTLNTSLIENT